MWQAGWHFTQWQHIARSPLSLFSLCLFLYALSFSLLLLFLFWRSLSFFVFSVLSFSSISSAPYLSLTVDFLSLALCLSLSLLPLPFSPKLLMKKLVVGLKQHLGIFSMPCWMDERICVCGCVHYELSCLFIVTCISLLLPRSHIVPLLLRCDRILNLTEHPEYFILCIALHTVWREKK